MKGSTGDSRHRSNNQDTFHRESVWQGGNLVAQYYLIIVPSASDLISFLDNDELGCLVLSKKVNCDTNSYGYQFSATHPRIVETTYLISQLRL
jgi:hypothetical protein